MLIALVGQDRRIRDRVDDTCAEERRCVALADVDSEIATARVVWTPAGGLAGFGKSACRSASVGRLLFGNCKEMFCSVSCDAASVAN